MKVYSLNDCDWYMANSLGEAIAIAMKDTGLSREEIVDDPQALSDADMERLIFDNQDGQKWSFAVQMQKLVEAGKVKPGMFASTEW